MKAAWARIALLTRASAIALGSAQTERSPDVAFAFCPLASLRMRGLL
jgi:hypothetical protein